MQKENLSEKKEKNDKTIVIPLTKELWKALKMASIDKEISMTKITRLALEKYLKKA